MSFEAALTNEKRGKSVITWSAVYLIAAWLSITADLLNPDSNTLMISDLLYLPIFPALIGAFFLTWRWLRSLVLSAKVIDPVAIGYRHGWAFWGWFTPIVWFWIPRRLLDRSQGVFTSYSRVENSLRLGPWWGLFIASSLVDYISFRAFAAGAENLVYLDIVGAILLTIAYPKWKLIVETLSNSQQNAITKFQTEAD